MSIVSKILTTTVIGISAVTGWAYLKNLKKASEELQTIPKASIHQLNWQGLTLRLDIQLKNPTKGSFSLKFPFVKLLYKDSVIGSSQVVNKDIKLPAYGEVMIDKVLIQVPMQSVFSVVFTLVKALFNKETVTLTVRTITTIDIGLVNVPYENKQNVTVKM